MNQRQPYDPYQPQNPQMGQDPYGNQASQQPYGQQPYRNTAQHVYANQMEQGGYDQQTYEQSYYGQQLQQENTPYQTGYDQQYDGAYMNASTGGEPPEEKKKKHRFLFWLIFLIALCVFLYSAYQLFTIFKANWDEKRELENLTEIANIPDDPEQPFTVNWEELRKVNDHVAAWLIIPDTNISYPIVLGEDNQYYLEHTFAKEYNYAGAIFIDYHNKPDFSDNNTFIYGHNVRHGTMFAELEKFTDQQFFQDHKYVYLFTPEQNYRAEVVSFQSVKDGTKPYQFGITDVDAWKEYIKIITAPDINGFVRSDVQMGESDRMISLSTCSYEINNELTDQRYLLHAKLVPWIGKYTEQGQEGPSDPQANQ